jgi:hypothetical protein
LRFAVNALALLVAALALAGRAAAFDADRAFYYLEAQCAFGSRAPGQPGHEQCLEFLERELGFWADSVYRQPFDYYSYDQKVKLSLTNLVARFAPEKTNRVLLCAHWDTRPFADRDPDEGKRALPILGANDGASGVAVLLEIARQIYMEPVAIGVDIVFFDGEDFGREGVINDYLIGSEHFITDLPRPQPRWGILLDMVGDRDLSLPYEIYSYRYARAVIDKIYAAAARQKATPFVFQAGVPVMDDHHPLLKIGIPTADIIDFDYPAWHTLADTPAQCSAWSLGHVGRTVLDVLRHEQAAP